MRICVHIWICHIFLPSFLWTFACIVIVAISSVFICWFQYCWRFTASRWCVCSISIYFFAPSFRASKSSSPRRNERVKWYCELCVVFICLAFFFFLFLSRKCDKIKIYCDVLTNEANSALRESSPFSVFVFKIWIKKESKNADKKNIVSENKSGIDSPVAIRSAIQFSPSQLCNKIEILIRNSEVRSAQHQPNIHTHTKAHLMVACSNCMDAGKSCRRRAVCVCVRVVPTKSAFEFGRKIKTLSFAIYCKAVWDKVCAVRIARRRRSDQFFVFLHLGIHG